MTDDRAPRAVFPLLLLCFFFSGFAALLYQTVWAREFAFVFGTSDLAVAAVLAAYMGGLAAGALLAGRFIRRVDRPVLVYGLLELGIALLALAVPLLIVANQGLTVWLFGSADGFASADTSGLAVFRLASAFAILFLPTAMMGATLPLLARHAVRDDETLGARIGTLYAINTVGAVTGVLCAGFLLIPSQGLLRTTWVGVALNVLVFVLAVALARRVPNWRASTAPAPPSEVRLRHTVLLPVMLASGACSFVYEVLWTRLLGHLLGGSVYAFATMLASFLAGIAIGGAVGAAIARTRVGSVRWFVFVQIGIAATSVGALFAMARLPELAQSWGVGGQVDIVRHAALAAMCLLPSALFIGATYPLAVRIVADGENDAGPVSARVYGWNTVGAIVGAIGAGFVLIPALGYEATLLGAVAVNLLLALAVMVAGSIAPAWWSLPVALAVVAFVSPLASPEQVLRYNPLTARIEPGEVEFRATGRSATVLVLHQGNEWRLSTNGLPEAAIRPVHQPLSELTAKWLTALPVAARPKTENMLVVGFGGGRALEQVPSSVRRIDVIELEEEVIAANRHLGSRRSRDPFDDPRLRVVTNDARGALVLTGGRYDAIVSQPSHPWTAGASHLYTREFFELAKRRLTEGGVFVQWIGLGFVDEFLLKSLVATLGSVFSNVRVYTPPPGSAVLFLASDAPLDLEATTGEAIAASRADFSRVGVHAMEDVLAALALDSTEVPGFEAGAAISTDDRNVLQLRSPKVMGSTLNAKRFRAIAAPFDPLPGIAERVTADRIYLTRRILMYGDLPRVQSLARDDVPEGERLALYGSAGMAFGRPDAVKALQRSLALAPDDGRVAMALLRVGRQQWLAGRPLPAPIESALGPAARLVLEGWQLEAKGDFRALATLDEALAAVAPRDPAWPDANRIRVQWRLDADDSRRRGEAIALLDKALHFYADPEDFVIRAELAVDQGYRHYALDLLTHARTLMPLSSRPAVVGLRASGVLIAMRTDGLGDRYYALKRQFAEMRRRGGG